MSGFLTELKQRRMVRVLVPYLIAAWVAIEVSSTVAPLLGLPDWVPRLVLVFLAAAFPPTMILAWFFDWDPDSGFSRATRSERSGSRWGGLRTWVLGGAATAVFAVLGFGLGLRWNAGESHAGEARVVVSVFENRTGDETLAPLGHMASDWVTQGLTEAGFIEVADPQTAFAAFQQAEVAAGGVAPTSWPGKRPPTWW